MRRLGATQGEHVDVWIISADQRGPRGRRQDRESFELISTTAWRWCPLSLPPLRERDDDAILLAKHFLARASADYGLPSKTLTADASSPGCSTYGWPGNIRELANTMERAALLSETSEVSAAVLELNAAPRSVPLSKTSRPSRPIQLNNAIPRAPARRRSTRATGTFRKPPPSSA